MQFNPPYRIVAVFDGLTDFTAWSTLALGLLPQTGGEVYLHGVVTVAHDKSLSEGALQARELRHLLKQAAQVSPDVYAEADVQVGHTPLERVLGRLRREHTDLLLLFWHGPHARTGGLSTNEILQQSPCDVVLLSGAPTEAELPVLLSLRGGANTTLGVRVAKALAGPHSVTLFHAASTAQPAPNLHPLQVAEPKITRTMTVVSDFVDAVVQAATGHKALVLGATFYHNHASASRLSPVLGNLYQQLNVPIALVRTFHPENMDFHPPLQAAPQPVEDASTLVDRWFAERNFHSDEFSDLRTLVALKEQQGLTISVGLPTLNEAETLGTVIRVIQDALVTQVPLIDQLVVIDSGSTDATVAIAEAHGLPVYQHSAILPELGSYRGKGEALWKSLHVLTGDLIAWVDTDITNIHPRFIYGLLGPLLHQPEIYYVKGFYHRPIRIDGQLHAYGGGRVTELVARPMLNLFYPELSGFVQPLAGEYAGRRTALAAVPFFTGYGVETGLLIDLYQRFGLAALAQTDLEERIHRNQPLVSLSKMAFAIMQAFIARIEQRYSVHLLKQAQREMRLIAYDTERFALDVADISEHERPAMNTLASYRERA